MRNDHWGTSWGMVITAAAGLLVGGLRCPAQPVAASQPDASAPVVLPSVVRPLMSESSDDFLRRGVAEYEARHFDAARPLLLEALARQPQRCDIALKLAEAEHAAGAGLAASRRVGALLASSSDGDCRAAALRLARRISAWNEICTACMQRVGTLEPEELAIYILALEQSGQSQLAGEVLQGRVHASGASPAVAALWVRWLIEHGRSAQALDALSRAEARSPLTPELHLLAARVYYNLDQLAGRTTELQFADAEPGQFRRRWLLLERKNGDRFTCCPPESAIFHLRCAEDGGLATPEHWLLGARIWRRLGHPQTAYETLRNHEPALIDGDDAEALALLSELALVVHEPVEYLRLTRLRAGRDPARHDDLMYQAHLALSDYYAARGDDALHLDALRRALALKSENPELVLELADREFDAGHQDAARLWYRKALELAPWHVERRRMLERIGGTIVP